jgi:hypothetical protein
MTLELTPHTQNIPREPDPLKRDLGSSPPELISTRMKYETGFSSFKMPIGDHETLSKVSKLECQRQGMEFAQLAAIQKKFLTHYRCSQCGLLPLFYVNFAHPRRVRCGKCHQLMSFRSNGKYGKLRKAIVSEMFRLSRGGSK